MSGKDIPWFVAKLRAQSEPHQQWLSADIKNELFNIFADQVVELIVQCDTKSQEFGLIVDETTGIGNDEQVSICLQ